MTIAFWVLAANLTIIALLIVVVPIWLKRDIKIDDNQQHNLDIGRQKLTELKSQRDLQKLSQAEYEEQLTELELALDDELSLSSTTKPRVTQGRWIIAFIAPLLPISAIAIYAVIGAPQMIEPPAPAPVQASANPSGMPDINAMLAKLLARLEQHPEDLKGWLMLGRTYMYMKDFANATAAFAKANRLQTDDADILIQYADAMAMSSGGQMTGKPTELVIKALSIQPEHTTGLWLAGMAKAEQGQFQAALAHWQKLAPLIVNDPQSTTELQKLMNDARARAGLPTPEIQAVSTPTPAISASTSVSAPALKVRVELSADLQQQAAPTDTLFIYAQALQGMRMPLAVVRKQVKDLPITVTLSDAQAMSPMAKISNNKQVKILARISKAGSAMPQSGDLFGLVAPVQVSTTATINVVIAQVRE